MLRSILALLLTSAIVCVLMPVPSQAQTQDELQAAFAAELLEYAATHTDEEVVAYGQWRINQMTNQTVGATGAIAGGIESDRFLL